MSNDNGESDVAPTESGTIRTVGNLSHGSRETPATTASSMEAVRSEKARCHTSDKTKQRFQESLNQNLHHHDGSRERTKVAGVIVLTIGSCYSVGMPRPKQADDANGDFDTYAAIQHALWNLWTVACIPSTFGNDRFCQCGRPS